MEGLFDEIAGPALQGADRHRYVAVAGDEDDRQLRAQAVELLVQFEAAHFRHAHVEHQAAAHVAPIGLQEGFRRVETGHLVAFAFQQPGHRIAHRFVVIDDMDGLCAAQSLRSRHLPRWVR